MDVGLSSYTLNRTDGPDTTDVKKPWPKTVLSLFAKDKLSTDYYFAGETRLGYQEKTWGAQLIFKRIDPGYQSMGAYFFQNDIREFSLANNFKLDSGKLNINTNIGFQTDNLKKQKTMPLPKDLSGVLMSIIILPKNLESILTTAISESPITPYKLHPVMNCSSRLTTALC